MTRYFPFLVAFVCVLVMLTPTACKAGTFPADAKSIHFEQLANGQVQVLPAADRTILYVGILFDGTNASAGLWCGAVHVDGVNDILETHAKPANEQYFMSYHCNDVLTTSVLNSTGAFGHYFITYVDRDVSLVPPIEDIIFVIGIVGLWAAGYRSGLMR